MNEPKLRFPEFTGDWKEHELAEMFNYEQPSKYIVKNDDYEGCSKYPVLTANKGFILGYTDETDGIYDKGNVIIFDDFTCDHKFVNFPFKVKSSAIKLLTSKDNYDLSFLSELLSVMNQQPLSHQRHWISVMQPSTALVPSFSEQQKIASLFSELDNLIQSAEKELEGYRELKQGMLQKMFPKKGETTPEIRFPEFTGDWEHRKFGEVLETVTDYVAAGSFADLAKNVEYKDYPDYAQLIRTMDLKNGFTSAQEVYVDKNAFDYLHRVNMDKECIILPNIGNCGEVYYVKPESLPYEHNVLGPNAIFVRSETCANNFLSILLQAKDFQTKLKLIISPNGQTKFNKTELKGIDLILPGNVYEQEKIGQYFENLDSLIALQQKEIDGYKELKKGLLQQMFC